MSLSTSTRRSILVRCDGSSEIGLGHVVRCLALADELRDFHGCQVAFAMRSDPVGFQAVHKKGYRVVAAPGNGCCFDYAAWIDRALDDEGAHALLLDIRDELPIAPLRAARERGILVATLDDPGERRLAADLAFYPPVPQFRHLDWTGFTGKVLVGWEWVILRRQFVRRPGRRPSQGLKVLVMMGGSDAAGLTLKAIAALDSVHGDFETVIVLGSGFAHHEALANLLAKARRHFVILSCVEDVAGLMASSDLAVASFGVTAYELAAMGVPAIYLCLTKDHAQSAEAFVEAGVARSLGEYESVADAELAATVRQLLDEPDRLRQMAGKTEHLVDGRGASRVAQVVVQRITS